MNFDLVLTISGFALLVLGGTTEEPTAEVLFFKAPGHRTVLTYLPRNDELAEVADVAVPDLRGRVLARIELDEHPLRLGINIPSGDPVPPLELVWANPGEDLRSPVVGEPTALSFLDFILPLDRLGIQTLSPALVERQFGGGALSARFAIPGGRVGSTQIVTTGSFASDNSAVFTPVTWELRRVGATSGDHRQILADAVQVRIENIASADFQIGDRHLPIAVSPRDGVVGGRPQVSLSVTNLPAVRMTGPQDQEALEHVRLYYRAAATPIAEGEQLRPVRVTGAVTSGDPFCPMALLDLTARGEPGGSP